MITTIRRFCSRLLSNKKYCYIALATIAVILICIVCVAGVRQKKKIKEIRIGICLHSDTEIFVNSIVKNMKEWCRNKENQIGVRMTLDVVTAKDSQLEQNDQVDDFVKRGYDVICVNLVDRSDASTIIDKAMEANTPVVFFNREPVEEDLDRWDGLYYVGAAAEQSGRLQAEIIIDKLSDSEIFDTYDINHNGVIQYVILEGETGHQDAIIRTRVVTNELKSAGFELEKLGDEYANWSRDQAKTKMKSLIEKYPFQIEMVIANNDEMALGAIEALEEYKYPINPLVMGIDGTDEGLEAVRVGKLDGSVYNDAKGQAETIMRIAYAQAVHNPIPEDITLYFGKYAYLPYAKITYENVQNFISEK